MNFTTTMATEALDVHFNGFEDTPVCCSRFAPCDMAKFLLTEVDGSRLSRDDDRSTGLEEARKPGNGTGAGRFASTAPSEKQEAFLHKMCEELMQAPEGSRARFVAETVAEDLNAGKLDRKKASWWIDALMIECKRFRSGRREAAPELSEGMYQVGGTVYKVVRSKAGRLYAKELTEDGFGYAAGAMRVIRPEHLMTLAEAQTYGRRTGSCCVCGRELTKRESIERGIGPVCAGGF